MSGLLALLDDVAAIAKVAAASVDDVVGQAAKAGAKAAGAVIDDAAVTPKYVTGFKAERELPIVWKIARGSIFNKLVILLPVALLLSAFAPWAIAPLLMLGGAYLCFEGAHKVWHWLRPPPQDDTPLDEKLHDAVHLEETKVRGAIKTDFILSAEIMTIALAELDTDTVWFEAAALIIVAVAITVAVYGAVALIVKADDVGLHMAAESDSRAMRAAGHAIVTGMPTFLKGLMVVGTAAMLWVGGAIIVHGLAVLGAPGTEHVIHEISHAFAPLGGLFVWLAEVALLGAIGMVLGTVIMPVAQHVVGPALQAVGLSSDGGH